MALNFDDIRGRITGQSQGLTDALGTKIGSDSPADNNSAQSPVGYLNQAGEFVSTKLSSNVNQSEFQNKSQEKEQPMENPVLSSSTPEQFSDKPRIGFVPVEYYLTGTEVYLQTPESLAGKIVTDTDEAKMYMKMSGRYGFYDGVRDPDYGFRYNLEDIQSTDAFSGNGNIFNITPKENEDPLYIGFEIRIKRESSPLFNGEMFAFLKRFDPGFNTEMSSKIAIAREFCEQAERFFAFDLPPIIPTWAQDVSPIFSSPTYKKRYYLNKVAGLDKLSESNTGSALSSFVKYRTDLITLTFKEDTTLSLGTLFSLYKQLYWSRLNGKNLIPENILRFDCQIILSEVRNFTRIVKSSSNGADLLRTLHDNVSRYVYDVYECQLFVDKHTHGDSVALSAIVTPEDPNVSFTYKYSNMRFERFNFAESKYKFISDRYLDSQKINSYDADRSVITEDGVTATTATTIKPIAHGVYGKDREMMEGNPDPSLLSLDGSIPGIDNTQTQSADQGTSVPPTDISSDAVSTNDLSSVSTPLAPETPAGSPDTTGGALNKLRSNQKIGDFLNKSGIDSRSSFSNTAANTGQSSNPAKDIFNKISGRSSGDSSNSSSVPQQASKFKLLTDSLNKVNTSFLKDSNGGTPQSSNQSIIANNSKVTDALNTFGGDSLSQRFGFLKK
jgi:hypothetical protein